MRGAYGGNYCYFIQQQRQWRGWQKTKSKPSAPRNAERARHVINNFAASRISFITSSCVQRQHLGYLSWPPPPAMMWECEIPQNCHSVRVYSMHDNFIANQRRLNGFFLLRSSPEIFIAFVKWWNTRSANARTATSCRLSPQQPAEEMNAKCAREQWKLAPGKMRCDGMTDEIKINGQLQGTQISIVDVNRITYYFWCKWMEWVSAHRTLHTERRQWTKISERGRVGWMESNNKKAMTLRFILLISCELVSSFLDAPLTNKSKIDTQGNPNVNSHYLHCCGDGAHRMRLCVFVPSIASLALSLTLALFLSLSVGKLSSVGTSSWNKSKRHINSTM